MLRTCRQTHSFVLVFISLAMLTLLGACATPQNKDPIEPVNRVIYKFNDGLDRAIVKPLAQGYRAALPSFARTSIANVFENINDVLVSVNNLLQGKLTNAVSDAGRVAVNSTLGILGLIDVATNMGLEKHHEDFGQTLGYWGIGDGAFIMIPLLGPSNLRDGIAKVADVQLSPLHFLKNVPVRNSLTGTRLISTRANLLDETNLLDEASLDAYAFMRDAYIQRRRSQIYDGNPPDEIDDEDKPAINNKLKTNKPQASQSLNDNVTSNEPANTIAQITHSHSPNWTPAREISDASDAMAPGASPSKLIANDHAIVVNAKPN